MTYYKLRELAEPAIFQYSNRANIRSIDASFEETLSIARKLIENNEVDAFVSAGSNASILREHLQLPVISIEVSGYDLLRSLMEAKRYGKKVGVISFKNALPPLKEFASLLNLDLYELNYHSPNEAIACIEELEKEKVDVIIGSSLIFDLSTKKNLNSILVYSLDSIHNAFDQALEVCRIKKLESNRFFQINNILQTLPEAVVAVDVDERITAINKKMKMIISSSDSNIYGKVLSELNDVLSLKKVLSKKDITTPKAIQLGGKSWFAVSAQIFENDEIIGATLTLYDSSLITNADEKIRIFERNNLLQARFTFSDILGNEDNIKETIHKAKRYAESQHDILIIGETGTGKELFAQSIHNASSKANKPFIAINCASFPETLIESELFGHEEGAFTGSKKGGRRGLIEAAHTGTLFLDEIGDMPLSLQTRLLRVLQEREITRLGSTTPIPIDIRLIAATHQNLKLHVKEKKFRQDLFFRLNTLQIKIPPLRERKQDIYEYFKLKITHQFQTDQEQAQIRKLLELISPYLSNYFWPGNFRELESITNRIVLLLSEKISISFEELLNEIPEIFELNDDFNSNEPLENTESDALKHQELSLLIEKETSKKQQALKAMKLAHGQHIKASNILGISRTTLWRWLNED
ncbi:hypothetical protein AMD27_05660 [Acinetobacter sp. TGL-Y2]|nr:hypothetical protein AMD27_05660 [Acinetobacter sp. TGL-Y2]